MVKSERKAGERKPTGFLFCPFTGRASGRLPYGPFTPSLPARGDRIPALAPKRPRGHARPRRRLATLELIEQHQPHYAAHGIGMEPLRGDLSLRLLGLD